MEFKGDTKDYIVHIPYKVHAGNVNEGIDKIRAIFSEKGFIGVNVEYVKHRRSDKQNRAMHLFFTQLADALNEAGFDMKHPVWDKIDLPWDSESVKEELWRRVQKVVVKKKSTTTLTTDELDKVYEILNKIIGEKTGVHIPFPNIETLTGNV